MYKAFHFHKKKEKKNENPPKKLTYAATPFKNIFSKYRKLPADLARNGVIL